ncbi:hypothetical protein QTJ16_001232 [Diplocarpon rosae]|uniref:C2H2-type domain-containing protein n=1 Tax=Diplocarpon rosae TaxID=946125 RepID=A0AAD9T7N1_9HELO|nr:hypothetical protein QTJ16_001232 [Diplocarpon rosae]PBP28839.1 c2h2 finger domain containing protein [Diplocarpon rosae]
MASIAETTYYMLPRHMSDDREDVDFPLYPDPNMFSHNFPFSATQNFNTEPYAYPRTPDGYSIRTGSSSAAPFADAIYHHDSSDLRAVPSNYSTASGPSAASSAMGSPHSIHGHIVTAPEWPPHGLGLDPGIVSYENFAHTNEYTYHQPTGMDDFALEVAVKPNGFVDPSILHPQYTVRPTPATQSHDISVYPPPTYSGSPSLPQMSRSPRPVKQGSQSPYSYSSNYPYPARRRPSIQSYGSQDGNFSSEESKEKGRCTYPECGKVFKDLKAHMLTHQNERPEKCPIQTCDYHTKGFARKYDKNRHTLTHYKGTMVCGFCPGSGSAAEKSFNRADVFKRHLTSVHAVEQTPPNSRKKISSSISSTQSLLGYAPDATGKCSTCSGSFGNAQDFYEHLDDCVLRIVQQEEPSEAINAARLAEVEQDHDVDQTLRNHALPLTTTSFSADEDEDDEEFVDENDDDFTLRNKPRKNKNRNPANGVQKSRGLTHSNGGVTLHAKGRKKRKDFPSSWGAPTSQMKMKKRVLCVFDGPRRLWKDDMMLDTDYEVRLKLQNEKAYVTDLDVQTMRRADALHQSTEEEKGPWATDDLTGIYLEKLMEVKRE